MKNGKLHRKSSVLKILLGLAVAGALLLASCQNIFDMPGQTAKGDGKGTVVVNLGDVARTAFPGKDQFMTGGGEMLFTFKSEDGLALEEKWTYNSTTAGNAASFRLPEGWYSLEVNAYAATKSGADHSATGVYRDNDGKFFVEAEKETIIYIVLTATETAGKTGFLNVTVTLPPGADGVYRLEQFTGPDFSTSLSHPLGNPIANGGNVTYTGADITITNQSLAVGTYLLTGRINTDEGEYGGFTEAIHIADHAVTDFTRDYTDSAILDGILAKIIEPEDAYEILREEIEDWITANSLAKVGGVSYVDATGEPGPGENGTIILKYVASRAVNGAANATFPIRLQGGWTQTAADWNVGDNNDDIVINLDNPKVKANGAPIFGVGKDTKYTVILRPVVEFSVTYDPDFTAQDKLERDITIYVGGEEVPLAPNTNVPGERVGTWPLPGTLEMTVMGTKPGAITVDGLDTFTSNDTTGVVTVPPSATNVVSRPYSIVIYKTAAEQKVDAYNRLVSTMAPYGGVAREPAPAGKPEAWFIYTIALTHNDWQTPAPNSEPLTALPANSQFDPITLYYVESRIPSGVISLQWLPPNTRWSPGTDMDVTLGATTSAGFAKKINFTPYGGGSTQQFDLKLVPVAEFYVDYFDIQPTNANAANRLINNGTLVIADSGTPADSAGPYNVSRPTTAAGSAPAAEAASAGRRILLATTVSITPTNATLMINEADTNSNGVFTDDVDYSTVPKDTLLNTGAGGINNNSLYAMNMPASNPSREYRIRVYPSIQDQKDFAIARLEAETNASRWLSVAPSRLENFNSSVTDINSIKTSEMRYVKARNRQGVTPAAGADPVLDTWPTDDGTYITPFSTELSTFGSGKFWNTIDSTASLDVNNGNRLVLIKIQYYGGAVRPYDPGDPGGSPPVAPTPAAAVLDTVYQFNVVQCAEIRVRPARLPIGASAYAQAGTVTIAGGTPGLGTAATIPSINGPFSAPPATLTDAHYTLVGTGDAAPNVIKINGGTAASLDALIITGPADVTSEITGNGTNEMQILNAGLESTTYEFVVYPSKNQQKTNVLTYLRGLENIDTWGIDTTAIKRTVRRLPLDNSTPLASTFQVVGDLTQPDPGTTEAPLKANGPASLFNSEYSGTSLVLTQTGARDDNGNKTITMIFTASGNASTTPADDQQAYTFNLTEVAVYSIKFMPGPVKDWQETVGDIGILTFDPPGGNNLRTAPSTTTIASWTTSQEKPTEWIYVGGVGDATAATNALAASLPGGQINSVGQNVFRLGLNSGTPSNPVYDPASNADFINGADATPALRTITLEDIVSEDYVIEIYPTAIVQRNQVVEAMRNTKTHLVNTPNSTNNGWLTVPANTEVIASPWELKPVSGNISEVQYIGSSAPTPKVPAISFLRTTTTRGNGTSEAYFDITDSGSSDYEGYLATTGTATLGLVDFNFKPIGAPVINNIYQFRLIPLAKYTVVYSEGAVGTITITPPTAALPTPSTPNHDAFTVIPTTEPKSRYMQIGSGSTNFKITAGADQFTDVGIFLESNGNQQGSKILSPNATTPANPSAPNNVNFTPVSTSYEIRVFLKQ